MLASALLTRAAYADAVLHFGPLSRSWVPLLVIRLPAALDDDPQVSDGVVLWRLRGQGWGNPADLLRGGDLDCLARASIDGVGGDDPVTVAFDGRVLFHGPVDRSPAWVDAVRGRNAVPVLMTTADRSDDLTAVARDGLLVAAWARVFHRGPGVAHPVL